MHDGVQYDPIQGQGYEPFKVGNPVIFNSYLLRHLQWELATNHRFLNYGTISKFGRAGLLIFGLVFVSRGRPLVSNSRARGRRGARGRGLQRRSLTHMTICSV